MGRSTAVLVVVGGLVAGPAAAGPLGPPEEAPTEWTPGPEDGPASLDGWPDGDWDARLTGAYDGRTSNGGGELTAGGSIGLVVAGGQLAAATPFQLGLVGPAEGWSAESVGDADVSWVYAGDVAASGGQVVLRAASVAFSLENMVVNGENVEFPAQTYDAENVFPLVVTSSTCGLVQGTWEGDAVQGMMELGGGEGTIVEQEPRRFRAVSDDIDTDWLERAEAVAKRVEALNPLDGGFLADVRNLVLDAERLAREAGSDPCAQSFSLGIDAQIQAALLAFLEGLVPTADQLWQVAELLARSGVLPGSPAHAAASAQLNTSIDLLAQGDVATAVQLLQVALALGDSVAAARLQQRIGDPGGQVPGSWLPGA